MEVEADLQVGLSSDAKGGSVRRRSGDAANDVNGNRPLARLELETEFALERSEDRREVRIGWNAADGIVVGPADRQLRHRRIVAFEVVAQNSVLVGSAAAPVRGCRAGAGATEQMMTAIVRKPRGTRLF